MEHIIEANGIVKTYGTLKALNQVNITVNRGDIYGLIGDNGAGKTTFLKLLSGQSFQDGGELKLFGAHLPREQQRQRRRMGALIESPGFYPSLSVERNLEYCRLQKGVPGKETVEEILKLVGLWERRKSAAKKLSMGMKQRLGLAIALLGEPELLVLDEPINGLDPSGIIEMRNLLKRLNREKNITIILSSHILSELEQIATVYGFLSQGRLLEQISDKRLRENCRTMIEILVSDPERYAVCLEQQFPELAYRVLPDKTIQIPDGGEDLELYSRIAMEREIVVLELHKQEVSLENYYVNLKENEKMPAAGARTILGGKL